MALSQSENAEVLRPSLPFLQLSLFLLTTMKVRKFLHVSSNESTQEGQVDTASALADGQQSSAFFGDGVT